MDFKLKDTISLILGLLFSNVLTMLPGMTKVKFKKDKYAV